MVLNYFEIRWSIVYLVYSVADVESGRWRLGLV